MSRRRLSGFAVLWLAPLAATVLAHPGDRDQTFGTRGLVALVDNDGPNHNAANVIQQPDDRLVATGRLGSTFAVVRLGTDGILDPSFGTGGILLIPDFGVDAQGSAVVRQPDGKLVAAGNTSTFPQTGPHYALFARVNERGLLDPTFGTGGLVRLPMSNIYYVSAAALQPDGKIVAAGALNTGVGFERNGVVLRLAADGSLDPTFGSGGIRELDVGAFDDVADLALQPDGRIVVSGGGGPVVAADLFLARLTPDGALDPGFGTGGYVTKDIGGSSDLGTSVIVQPDGRIVVGTSAASVLRYNERGVLDPGFGTAGSVEIPDCRYAHVARQADGKLVVSGSSFAPRNVLVLARMDPDGTLDPSFGVSGIVAHTVGDGSPIAVSLLVQRDGRYVVAGQTQSAAVGSQFGVLRFLAGTCGNRTVEPGETCDDGNTAGDDCCSEGCLLEPAGEPCAADVLRCTLDRCDGAGRCEHPADLRTDCRVSVAPGAGQLRLRNERRDGRDLLEWRWAKGEATSVAELGEPFEPTDYTLCGFDLSSDPAGTPLFEMSAPGGGTCGAGPCWALPSLARVRYRNQSRTPDGLAALVIGAGIEGRTRIVARGKGKLLGLPSLPLPLPVVVQLHAANGLCWEARYSSGGVGANARTHFSGRAD